MKLVNNWKKVLLKSHSMWAVYLGMATLVVPEALYWFTGTSVVSPYLTGILGVALLVYGGFGRVIDQEIDRRLDKDA